MVADDPVGGITSESVVDKRRERKYCLHNDSTGNEWEHAFVPPAVSVPFFRSPSSSYMQHLVPCAHLSGTSPFPVVPLQRCLIVCSDCAAASASHSLATFDPRRRGAARSLPVVLPRGVQTMSKWSEMCEVQSSWQLILWMHVWGRSYSLRFPAPHSQLRGAHVHHDRWPLHIHRFLKQFEWSQSGSAGANSNGIITCNKKRKCNSNRNVKLPLKWPRLKQT